MSMESGFTLDLGPNKLAFELKAHSLPSSLTWGLFQDSQNGRFFLIFFISLNFVQDSRPVFSRRKRRGFSSFC